MKEEVMPVKLDPSCVRTTVTALVDAPATPGVFPTVGCQPAIVPSSVEKMNAAGLPATIEKSVVLLLETMPVGVPVANFGSFGLDFGILTTKVCFVPGPSYKVANPVASSETHQVLGELRDRLQPLIS